MPGLRKYLVFCRFRELSIRPLCNCSKEYDYCFTKTFCWCLLPVMNFHFQKCTCNNIRNAKQYEGLSASILFYPWLVYVRFMTSDVEAYRLQRCNLDPCQLYNILQWLKAVTIVQLSILDVCRGPEYASGLPKNHTWQNICRISEPWSSDTFVCKVMW